MPTLSEIKEQVDKVNGLFKLLDEFDEEIEKIETEISEIEAKDDDIRSLGDFRDLSAKRNYLAELKKEREDLESNKILDIANQARAIDASGYVNETLENTESVKANRRAIKEKAIELLTLVNDYNADYEANAYRIAEEAKATGLSDLYDRINNSTHFQKQHRGYLESGLNGYIGSQFRKLDDQSSLAYMIERIQLFEGEE